MMRLGALLHWILAVPMALIIIGGAAYAAELTDDQRASLKVAVEEFDIAMRTNDFAKIIAVVPPRIYESIGKSAGVSAGDVRSAVLSQTKAALSDAKDMTFSMDFSQAKFLQAPDGTPYALIPTQTILPTGNVKVQQTSETFALIDEAKWYLLRTSELQQIRILMQVYPSFAGITFSAGTTRILPP